MNISVKSVCLALLCSTLLIFINFYLRAALCVVCVWCVCVCVFLLLVMCVCGVCVSVFVCVCLGLFRRVVVEDDYELCTSGTLWLRDVFGPPSYSHVCTFS